MNSTTDKFKVDTLIAFDAGEHARLSRVTESYATHFIYESFGPVPRLGSYLYSGGGTASVATQEQITNFINEHKEMIEVRISELQTLNTTLALVRNLSSRMEDNNEANL